MVKRALLAILVLCAGARGVAHAEPTAAEAEQAQKLFEAGRQAYDTGQYPLAISLFEEAYRIVPRPSVEFGLGQAYRRQYLVDGDPAGLDKSIDYYRKYLADLPDGDRRDEASRYVSDLELMRARLVNQRAAPDGSAHHERTQLVVFSATAKALASVDGAPRESLPLALDVAAGPHQVHVEAEGYFARDEQGVAVEGRLVPIEVNLDPKPARLAIRGPRGARVEIDGHHVGAAPLGAIELGAGDHFVAVHMRGHRPFTKEVVLARGAAITLDATLPKTAQRRASAWVGGAAALAAIAGGVTTGFAIAAAHDADPLESEIAHGHTLTVDERNRLNAAATRYDDAAGASYWLYGSAVVLGATALALYLLDDPSAAPPRDTHAGIMVGGGAAAVTWSGRF